MLKGDKHIQEVECAFMNPNIAIGWKLYFRPTSKHAALKNVNMPCENHAITLITVINMLQCCGDNYNFETSILDNTCHTAVVLSLSAFIVE